MSEETHLSSYLLGRLTEREARLTPPPAVVEPPAPLSPVEQWRRDQAALAARDASMLKNLEAAAGMQPPAAPEAPEVPPTTISRATWLDPRQGWKYAESVARGTTQVVD